MRAIILPRTAPIEDKPLQDVDVPVPAPKDNEVLVKVSACGLCHTDLDEIEGRLQPSFLPIILGHQVVGTIGGKGKGVSRRQVGERVGVTWLYSNCGRCRFCRTGRENLCESARWTGKDANGGYAEYMVVGEDWAHPIPTAFSDVQAAPLLCAGVIGYRSIRLADIMDGEIIAIFGFGASAHIVIQVLRHRYPNSRVLVLTRGRDHQDFAMRLGASWAGDLGQTPPYKADKAFDFTPIGEAVKEALAVLDRGGRLVINAIRKITPIPELPYAEYLWHERQITSVANVTKRDVEEFLPLAAQIPIKPTTEVFQPEEANDALLLLKEGKLKAAGVLTFER
jgi:propanol-preferring alcohol dehydrogenase